MVWLKSFYEKQRKYVILNKFSKAWILLSLYRVRMANEASGGLRLTNKKRCTST